MSMCVNLWQSSNAKGATKVSRLMCEMFAFLKANVSISIIENGSIISLTFIVCAKEKLEMILTPSGTANGL